MDVRTMDPIELTKQVNNLRVLNKECTRCGLGQEVRVGVGNCAAQIMIIADAPNSEMVPFDTRNGAIVDKILKWMGSNRKQAYLTYLTKCNTSRAAHRKNCDWIDKEIELINPKYIISFGKNSAKYLAKTLDFSWGVPYNNGRTILSFPSLGGLLKKDELSKLEKVFKNLC